MSDVSDMGDVGDTPLGGWEPLLERDSVRVSRSPWGSDDTIGRLNWMTPESRGALVAAADGARLFDLSVEFFSGMPSWTAAGDPPFHLWLTHTPDGSAVDGLTGYDREVHEKYSYCSDAMSMFMHLGTHIDTLVHLGFYSMFWNGLNVREHLGSRGWAKGGAEAFPPIVARGVLLDIARLHGVDCLPDDYAIGPGDLRKAAAAEGVELRRGDVVCIRTGRIRRWPAPEFLAVPMPGIDLAGARFLCEEAGAMIVGADTPALEVFPSSERAFTPVHAYMFATAGAPIIEVLWLEELAAAGVHEFVFTGYPLRVRGATGAPLRPVAMALRR